jgi:hypothetical protein
VDLETYHFIGLGGSCAVVSHDLSKRIPPMAGERAHLETDYFIGSVGSCVVVSSSLSRKMPPMTAERELLEMGYLLGLQTPQR